MPLPKQKRRHGSWLRRVHWCVIREPGPSRGEPKTRIKVPAEMQRPTPCNSQFIESGSKHFFCYFFLVNKKHTHKFFFETQSISSWPCAYCCWLLLSWFVCLLEDQPTMTSMRCTRRLLRRKTTWAAPWKQWQALCSTSKSRLSTGLCPPGWDKCRWRTSVHSQTMA